MWPKYVVDEWDNKIVETILLLLISMYFIKISIISLCRRLQYFDRLSSCNWAKTSYVAALVRMRRSVSLCCRATNRKDNNRDSNETSRRAASHLNALACFSMKFLVESRTEYFPRLFHDPVTSFLRVWIRTVADGRSVHGDKGEIVSQGL
jgi:hypothetical protein